jgi:hypothetical protein
MNLFIINSAFLYFFRFPTIRIVRGKLNNFFIENDLKVDDINKFSLICSSHFELSLFIKNKYSRRLPKTVIPNIIVTRIKNVSSLLLTTIFNKKTKYFFQLYFRQKNHFLK